MNDTPPGVEQRYRDMLLALPGARRVEMGASMYATARALVRAGILAERPNASEAEVRQALFLHFYRDDFPPRQLQRILVWVAQHPEAS